MTIKQQGGVFGRNPTFGDVKAKSITADTANISEVAEIEKGAVVLNGNTISALQVSIADDAVAELTFLNRSFGMLSVVEGSNGTLFPDTRASFLGYVDFGGSPSGSAIYTGSLTDLDNTNTLTGTTGVDGRITVGTAGTSKTLYIENREGGAGTFNVTLL
jgi:hypothetical protein